MKFNTIPMLLMEHTLLSILSRDKIQALIQYNDAILSVKGSYCGR